MNRRTFLGCFFAALTVAPNALRQARADEAGGTTILIIRHAEKPAEGSGLTPAGEARSRAYISYFQEIKQDGVSLTPLAIYATADSAGSQRPRLTVEPLALALRLPVNTRFKNKDVAELAKEIFERHRGSTVLVCWHHGAIAALLNALNAEPVERLLPGGEWPVDQYDWLLELRYDAHGQLRDARRIEEGLTGSR